MPLLIFENVLEQVLVDFLLILFIHHLKQLILVLQGLDQSRVCCRLRPIILDLEVFQLDVYVHRLFALLEVQLKLIEVEDQKLLVEFIINCKINARDFDIDLV